MKNNPEVRDAFRLRFRQLQIRSTKTVEEVAEAAGLTPQFVGRLLAGRHEPRIGVVIALAKALGVAPGAFLEPVERMKLGDRLKSSPVMVEKALAVKEAR